VIESLASPALMSPRALLVAPRYFGYEKDIAEELARQGMLVDMLPDRPFEAPLIKAAARFRPELMRSAADRFFATHLEQLARREYDLILVVQGEGVTPVTLRTMRAAYPRARLVFYTWDSLLNKPFARANLKYYDRCLGFDPIDARRYGMQSRPLFFSAGFERPAPATFKYDVTFVGTIHSDRYGVIRRIADSLPPTVRTHWYMYMQAPWMYPARKFFTRTVTGSRRADFRFQPLAKEAVQRIFFSSKAILDIEHPKQTGLTMRTIEALGSGTKLLTTNASVRGYDFYDADNICVVDRANPRIDPSFLESAYVAVSAHVYQTYKLSQWVQDVRSI
jgi:hypothetical protein